MLLKIFFFFFWSFLTLDVITKNNKNYVPNTMCVILYNDLKIIVKSEFDHQILLYIRNI